MVHKPFDLAISPTGFRQDVQPFVRLLRCDYTKANTHRRKKSNESLIQRFLA
jgi:hypothetical protein